MNSPYIGTLMALNILGLLVSLVGVTVWSKQKQFGSGTVLWAIGHIIMLSSLVLKDILGSLN